MKTDRPSPDGDRPNLLVGGFPDSGPNAEDSTQIYGNVFAHNPREALLQASGRVSIHDNVFFDTPNAAIVLQDLLEGVRDRVVVAVTFMAMLELVKGRELVVEQSEPWGPISVRRADPSTVSPSPAPDDVVDREEDA